MATITMTKTISAGDLTRAVAALRARYGMSESATNGQIQAEFEKEVWARLKGLVLDYEANAAAAVAKAAIEEITLT